MRPILKMIGRAALYCITTDRFKSEYFSLRYTLPLTKETAQETSLLPAVLSRGTERHPTKLLINRHLDELYSTTVSVRNQRIGDMHSIGLCADLLGSRFVGGKNGILPDVIEAMADLLYRPATQNGALRADFVESEKKHLIDGIRAAINNPRSYAAGKCRRLLCAGEPFALSLSGSEDTVKDITAATLTARHQALLHRAIPTFFYVGATAPDEVAAMIAASFPTFADSTAPYTAVVKRGEGDPVCGEEEMPLCQGKLSLGFRTDVSLGHRLAPATILLNEIYGGSPASKLFLNVRERRSLCYHCSSGSDLYKGVLFAHAGMTPENRRVTEEAMLEEFYALSRGEISDTELNAARRSLDHSYRQALDNPAALASFYGSRALIGNSDTVDSFRAAVGAVTKADVVEAAAHLRHGATFFLKGTLEGEEVEE